MSPLMQARGIRWIRWIAHLWAGISAFTIALVFGGGLIESGDRALLGLGAAETLMTVAFGAMWLGLALGWHQERLGGWLVVGGLAAFYAIHLAASATLPAGPWFALLAVPGFLYLYCARASRSVAATP